MIGLVLVRIRSGRPGRSRRLSIQAIVELSGRSGRLVGRHGAVTIMIIIALWVSSFSLLVGQSQGSTGQPSQTPAEVRRLAAEFESARRSAFDRFESARTEAQRTAANQALPDPRKYAQRFLDLARNSNEEEDAVDALVWVVRNGFGTSEGDEAVRKLADHSLGSDRIGSVCHALGARGPRGKAVLQRIFEENAAPGIRGRACLALAFARSFELRDGLRSQASPRQVRPDSAKAIEDEIQKRKSKSTALAAEIEQWLRSVLDQFPQILFEPDVSDNFGLLSENLGPAAGQILRRIADAHPQMETRLEAECALALQQMATVSLVAELQSVAAQPPDSKKCVGPALAAACIFGGEERLSAVDAKALVCEIEQRLQRIAHRVNTVKQPGICYFHLIMDTSTFSRYHAGTETLLRRVADGHPNSRFRAGARRALAIYLAGIADPSRTIEPDRIQWVNRLGNDRVEQIRHLNLDRVMQESRALAEEVAHENHEAGRNLDPKIEALRRRPRPR